MVRLFFMAICSLLFAGQLVGAIIFLVAEPWSWYSVAAGFAAVLGVVGFVTVNLLKEAHEREERLKKQNKRWSDMIGWLSFFIEEVVNPDHVAEVFQRRKHAFSAMSQSQIRFYQQREAELSEILKRNPDDADMAHYRRCKEASGAEEERLRIGVGAKKDEFWHFHKTVGFVNDYLGDRPGYHTFTRPDSIKLDEPVQEAQATT